MLEYRANLLTAQLHPHRPIGAICWLKRKALKQGRRVGIQRGPIILPKAQKDLKVEPPQLTRVLGFQSATGPRRQFVHQHFVHSGVAQALHAL